MRRIVVSNLAVLLVVWFFVAPCSYGLDYIPSWEFLHPIDERPNIAAPADNLIYDPATGSLTYKVGPARRWSPPDVGSKSGLLLPSFAEVALGTQTPEYQIDAVFEGEQTQGSTAIRIGFDRYAFWPSIPEDPRTLETYGLAEPPSEHYYGDVLPPGLSASVLQEDLYAASFPGSPIELMVVPEPSVVSLTGAALLFFFVARLQHSKYQGA